MSLEELDVLARTLWKRDLGGQTTAAISGLGLALLMFGLALFSILLFMGTIGPWVVLEVVHICGSNLSIVLAVVAGVALVIVIPALVGEWAHRDVRDRRLARAILKFSQQRPCAGCLYDLSNLQDGQTPRCPECGRPFTPVAGAKGSTEVSKATFAAISMMSAADRGMLERTLWNRRPVDRAWVTGVTIAASVALTCVMLCSGLPVIVGMAVGSLSQGLIGQGGGAILGGLVGWLIALGLAVAGAVWVYGSVRRQRIASAMLEHVGHRPCPRCLYDLSGLSVSGTCPECGWEVRAFAQEGEA